MGSRYGEYIHIYTDASEDPKTGHVGSAFIIPKLKVNKSRLLVDQKLNKLSK